jgi:hypothetical protein
VSEAKTARLGIKKCQNDFLILNSNWNLKKLKFISIYFIFLNLKTFL